MGITFYSRRQEVSATLRSLQEKIVNDIADRVRDAAKKKAEEHRDTGFLIETIQSQHIGSGALSPITVYRSNKRGRMVKRSAIGASAPVPGTANVVATAGYSFDVEQKFPFLIPAVQGIDISQIMGMRGKVRDGTA